MSYKNGLFSSNGNLYVMPAACFAQALYLAHSEEVKSLGKARRYLKFSFMYQNMQNNKEKRHITSLNTGLTVPTR